MGPFSLYVATLFSSLWDHVLFITSSCSIRPDYHDVSKAFYSDPEAWLSSEYPKPEHLPTHLVFFDVLLPVSLLGSDVMGQLFMGVVMLAGNRQVHPGTQV